MSTDATAVPAEPEPDAAPLVRVNLASGRKPRPGYVNLDINPLAPDVHIVADLEKRWPFDDESVDEFYCEDGAEHLRQWWDEPNPAYISAVRSQLAAGGIFGHPQEIIENLLRAIEKPVRTYGVIHFMNEAWRCLKVDGILRLRVPSTDGRGAFQDPTHVSYWNINSMMYFCDNNLRRDYAHMIKAKFKPVGEFKRYQSAQKPLCIVWEDVTMAKLA